MDKEYLGSLTAIYRYPVKGMRGEGLDVAEMSWTGLKGDRRFGFIEGGESRSGFPWLTGRKGQRLVQYRAVWSGEKVEGPPEIIRVVSADGTTFNLDDAELIEELEGVFGSRPQLVHFNRGCFDAMPISLISRTTVSQIGSAVGVSLDERRFRPNLVVDLRGRVGSEDELLGSALLIGEGKDAPILRVNRKNKRCVMITVDPESGEKTPEVLRVVARQREECAGVYGSTEFQGMFRVGDPIYRLT